MRLLLSFVTVSFLGASPCWAQESRIFSAWVQLGAVAEIRATASGTICPTIVSDGVEGTMTVRAVPDDRFPLVCSVPIAKGTKSLSVNGKALPLPGENPTRILVVGDTGCRVQGNYLQACNDPGGWVFPSLAAAAASFRPDLVIHTGDYVSREGACPSSFPGCGGSPFGDNWPTWQADFFAPAAPLLSAAPIVLARGNHEACNRQGLGWLRLMGQGAFDPAAGCARHVGPFTVPLGSISLAVLDTASAPESETVPDLVSAYAADLKSLNEIGTPVWMVQHRPILGAIAGPLGVPIGGNLTLSAAMRSIPVPASVDLMLSGHIHGFEAMNYYGGLPPQIIAGHGGDLSHDIPRLLKGALFQGAFDVTVKDGVSVAGYGFLLMTRTADGWDIDALDAGGTLKKSCQLKDRRIDCVN